MKNNIKQLFKILISVLLMYLLIRQIDYREFKEVLANVNVLGILIFVISYLFSIILNALKWKVLLPKTELTFLIGLCFRAQFYATVLPGQLFGEASKVTVWNNRDEDISEIAASVIFDKITGIIGQILIGVLGIYLSSKANIISYKWLLIALVGLGVFFIHVSSERHLYIIIKNLFGQIGKINKSLGNKLIEFYDAWYHFATKKGVLIRSILWGIFNQTFGIVPIWILSMTMGLKVGFIEYCWIIPLMSVVLLLPVSFAGVGLRDASIASMLSIFNVNKGSSLVITMSMLMAQIVAALIGGLYVMKKSIEKT